MATKELDIDGIGLVQFVKNRRSRSLKISLQPNGTVRVTLPSWAPYQSAVLFAQSKKEWIEQHRLRPDALEHGQAIGKAHHLYFKPSADNNSVTARQKGSLLIVSFPSSLDSHLPPVQQAARKLAIKALRAEAESLLPDRVALLAEQHGFSFHNVQVRQLKARWGSCNSKREITLNLFLMQLPWELIDYVIVHELCHTEHLHHGADFWEAFEQALPDAKKRRREIRGYKPAI